MIGFEKFGFHISEMGKFHDWSLSFACCSKRFLFQLRSYFGCLASSSSQN